MCQPLTWCGGDAYGESFFFSSRRRHTRCLSDWSSDVCSSDLARHGDVIELLKPAVFGKETTIVEMPIHWSTDDSPHFEFVRTETTVRQGLMNANAVVENWIDDFLYMQQVNDWGVITYTCHPFIIGRGHRMIMLEKLIRACAERGAVFLSMEDAVKEFQQRSPLKE